MTRSRLPRVLRHVSVWLGSWLALGAIIAFHEGAGAALRFSVPLMLAGPLPVYAHFVALTQLFERRRYRRYAVALAVIVAAAALWAEIVHGLIDRDPASHTNGVGLAILFLTFSTGFRYFSQGMSRQYRLQEAESRNLRAELVQLRAQIHPHFMFNTLNSLYALSLDRSRRLPYMILKLSDLMRYLLDDSNRPTVGLADEMGFIRSYIELERLRLESDSRVALRVKGDPGALRIAPMLMSPLVENCFKHSPATGARIDIRIEIDRNRVLFAAENGKRTRAAAKESGPGGHGLVNLRERLIRLYPETHELRIMDDVDNYRAELSLCL